MDIKFSKKYAPLFEILTCWDDLKADPKSKRLQELRNVDTVLMYGGRDSGKTFAESVFIPVAVKDHGHRVLYTRYTMNSTDNSISEALNQRMDLLGCTEEFKFGNNLYEHENKGKIFITGQKTSSLNQTAKLKSLEDFSIFVTDEAEEIRTFEEWDKIKKSIRAKDVQCLSLLVFNPPTKEHWLYTEFFEDAGVSPGFNGIKGNVLYIHTTYLDNIEHVAEHNLREYEKLRIDYEAYEAIPKDQRDTAPKKLKKNWNKYKHVVLGGFMDMADGVIYEDWETGEFDDSLPYCFGHDFGFDDPDANVKVAVDHKQKKIYAKEMLYQNGLGTDQLGELLLDMIGHRDLIIADSAHNRLINDLYHKGLNIRRCKKGAGSVLRRIKTVQGYTIIVDPDSTNIVKALNNFVWKDSRAGIPDNKWKHIPDAIGYAAMELIEY